MGQVCTTCGGSHPGVPTVSVRAAAAPGMDGGCESLVDLKDDFLGLSSRWTARSGAPDEYDMEKQYDASTAASSSSMLGQDSLKVVQRPVIVDADEYHMKQLPLSGDMCIFDINLHDGVAARQNVERYYAMCKEKLGLHVTTSCFTTWRKSKKTNGHAKVIPVHPADTEAVRVFFFDDNLEWGGHEESSGICNLRDSSTGEFVNFAEGENGFKRDRAARHTVIYHSDHYRTVLVKANILDAMEDTEYFSSIVERFSSPGEKFLIFMDVNSTIVCNDTIQGKDLGSTLLSTMFEFVNLRPREGFDFVFDDSPSIRIEKPENLKSLVKRITAHSHEAYGSFWTEDRCWQLFAALADLGEVTWSGSEDNFDLDDCQTLFKEYLISLGRAISKDGIAPSWFTVFDKLKGEHSVHLNSFGVDTRKVILATVPDELQALQVTVNYELWDARDVQKFEGQFQN
mmetsp:Transcript_103307/g.296602  ORF Transcript_103307/g.296602 Transcript_103307/m.296602 type:complete len:456 (+) Transcript_103307:120-1487(+)